MAYGDSRTVPRKRRPKVRAKPPSSGSRGSGAAPRGKGSQPISTPSPTPSKPKPYVRPRIERQPGPSSDKERTKIRRATGEQRPAPKSQPGPSSDRERRKVRKAKKQRAYQQAQKAARRAGRREDKRQLLRTLGASVGGKADTDTKVLGVNVEAELEGRGAVADVADYAKRKLATSETSKQALRSAGVPIPQGKLGSNVMKELIDIPTQAVPSAYMTGAAAVEAAQGRPGRAKKLWKDYKETSAIPKIVTGTDKLRRGDFKGAGKDLSEAGKRAHERPVSTGLELSGAKALVGRTGGAVARSGVAGKKVKRAGSVERDDLRLYPKELDSEPRNVRDIPAKQRAKARTGPREERHYSKDIINKAAQRTGERVARKRIKVRDRVVKKGRDPNVARPRPSMQSMETPVRRRLLRQVDTDIFAGEGIRRRRRDETVRETSKLAPPEGESIRAAVGRTDVPARHSYAVQLAAEGVIRRPKTFTADLRKELGRLEREAPAAREASKVAARENRAQRKAIEKLLKDKSVDPQAIFNAAREFGRQEGGRQGRLRELGQFSDSEHDARFMPYAQAHLGARPRGKGKGGLSDRLVVDRPNEALEDRVVLDAALKGIERWNSKTGSKVKMRTEPLLTGTKKAQKLVGTTRAKVRPITRKEIKDAAAREGVDPAFVTQRRLKTRTAMFIPVMRGSGPPSPGGRRRSGKSFQSGGREVGGAQMVRQAAMSEGTATAVESFNGLANKYAVSPRQDGGYANTWNEAEGLARELTEDTDGNLLPGHMALKPVNVAPFRGLAEQIERLHANAQPGTNIDHATADAFADSIKTAFEQPTTGRGKFALMPEDVIDRIKEHNFTRVRGERALESMTNTFKDVVLTTSSPTTWMLGNVADLSVRSAMAGLRPGDVVRGRKVVKKAKQLDARRGEEIEQTLTGGGLYHAGQASNVHRPTRVGESKTGRMALAPYRRWRDGVYALSRATEALPQYATVGKAMRQDVGMQGSLKGLAKLADDQVAHYAENLTTNRALEARLQRQVEDVIGRWGKVSPTMRRALGLGPFAQWLAAALRYVYITLPAKHPIKTGLLAAAYEMTEEERVRLGLTLKGDPDAQVLDYLQGSIPVGPQKRVPVLDSDGNRVYRDGKLVTRPTGNMLRTGRLTSFGTAGAFPGNVPEFILPQINSPLLALRGISWTGDKLVYPDDHPKAGEEVPRGMRQEIALGLLIEGTVPFASAYRRAVQEGGRSSDPTSTILRPETRKQWNKRKKRYEERAGGSAQGLSDWLNPLGVTVGYTVGDIASMERSKARGKVFEELNRSKKLKPVPWGTDDDGDVVVRPGGTGKASSEARELIAP